MKKFCLLVICVTVAHSLYGYNLRRISKHDGLSNSSIQTICQDSDGLMWLGSIDLIARYPAEIEAGTVCNAIVQYEDLLPTFLDIAGGEPRQELDGVSFKRALFGETNKARKYAYGIHNNKPEGDHYPIRSIRDDRYALLWNLTPAAEYYEKHLMNPDNKATDVWPVWMFAAESDPSAKFLVERFIHRPEFEFYDVDNDPWELNNLADDPQYSVRIAEMKAELEKWMAEQGDPGASMD